MKINHVAIYVNNLEKTKEFYVKYFQAKANEKYHNKKTGLQTYFLSFPENETRLEIMTRPDLSVREDRAMNEGFIHLAFSVGSKEKVDTLTAELKTDGYEVISGPRTTGDGYYESCIIALEDNQIEITI